MTKNLLCAIFIAFASCKGSTLKGPKSYSSIIELNSENIDSVLQYHTSEAIFYLPKEEVLHYCMTSYPELQIRKDLLEFVNINSNAIIIISDSLIEADSLNTKKYWQLREVIKWATVDILKSKHAKVFDKKKMQFVDFIKLIEINGKYHGEIEIRLPSDSLALHYSKYIV